MFSNVVLVINQWFRTSFVSYSGKLAKTSPILDYFTLSVKINCPKDLDKGFAKLSKEVIARHYHRLSVD